MNDIWILNSKSGGKSPGAQNVILFGGNVIWRVMLWEGSLGFLTSNCSGTEPDFAIERLSPEGLQLGTLRNDYLLLREHKRESQACHFYLVTPNDYLNNHFYLGNTSRQWHLGLKKQVISVRF